MNFSKMATGYDPIMGAQQEALKDIAKSLRVLSGRQTLKELRLEKEIEELHRGLTYANIKVDEKIEKKIRKLEEEIYNDRLKREEEQWNS